jgi:malate dehydrogenase (oxaloacetate-decarboxylating)(NADP+)
MQPSLRDASLALHASAPAGKLEVVPTKPLKTKEDLSLAYSPGVAAPVLEIAANPTDAYRYTGKGNLVAVISNGTAILGLGNRGALASKPVMEGKAVLFKRFAGIDAFDIEINSTNIDEVVKTVELLEPTFGGINLEDIKAPECFVIERRLIATMGIPVFHDDQHGTAVVVSAGLLNALTIVKKNIQSVSIVVNGAGAAGIAISRMLGELGVSKDQLLLCDSKGVLSDHRLDLGEFKVPFARKTPLRTLADALRGADVFIGVSKAGCVTPEMLQSMAKSPIVFALANPDPEIDPAIAKEVRPDVIIATGRSDHPNQVNNLLCFPFLFRGALDSRATQITTVMKLAAIDAISTLAREEVPEDIKKLYGRKDLVFGPTYVLPTPFDPRLLTRVPVAVAKAAIETGIAKRALELKEYERSLRAMSLSH